LAFSSLQKKKKNSPLQKIAIESSKSKFLVKKRDPIESPRPNLQQMVSIDNYLFFKKWGEPPPPPQRPNPICRVLKSTQCVYIIQNDRQLPAEDRGEGADVKLFGFGALGAGNIHDVHGRILCRRGRGGRLLRLARHIWCCYCRREEEEDQERAARLNEM
jgi:hypothetical protein